MEIRQDRLIPMWPCGNSDQARRIQVNSVSGVYLRKYTATQGDHIPRNLPLTTAPCARNAARSGLLQHPSQLPQTRPHRQDYQRERHLPLHSSRRSTFQPPKTIPAPRSIPSFHTCARQNIAHQFATRIKFLQNTNHRLVSIFNLPTSSQNFKRQYPPRMSKGELPLTEA